MIRATLVCSILAAAACGRSDATASPESPMPNRPLEAYARQGLITGSDDFPAVAGFVTLAGPADTSWVLFGMSLPTSALRFHREGNAFQAGYSVALRFLRHDGVEVAASRHGAQVRVASFEETGRTDESLLYQDQLLLPAGTYAAEVTIADSIGQRRLSVVDTITVPAYRSGEAALALVHEATPRASRAAAPAVVLNSRHSAPFGGPAPRLYVEAYEPIDSVLEVRVRDAGGAVLLVVPARVHAAAPGAPASAIVEVATDSLPLGLLTLSAGAQAAPEGAPLSLLVTISDHWMVSNYEEVLDYLTYIASREELDELRRAGTPAARRAAWDAFWERRDPVPASATNEYRDEFFARVRAAAEQFAEIGRPGWRTDRGRVYIVLGPPDRERRGEIDSRDLAGALDAIVWVYEREAGGRIELLFLDREGFGRFTLTRSSELTFRAIADRLRAPRD